MKKTYEVRKSIEKIKYHDTILGYMLKSAFLLLFPAVFLVSLVLVFQVSPWPLLILLFSVVLVILSLEWYTKYFNRFYRIVQRSVKNSQGEESQFVLVQYCISHKKPTKSSNIKGSTWKDVDAYSISQSSLTDSITEAEAFFDEKTIKNNRIETIISVPRKAAWKPQFYNRIAEKYNFSREDRTNFGIGLFIFASIFLAILIRVSIPFDINSLYVIVPLVILISAHFLKPYRLYLRLIERTDNKGTYRKTYYVAQAFSSRKKLESIMNQKNIKWTDYMFGEFKKENVTDKDAAHYYFNELTVTEEIHDKVL